MSTRSDVQATEQIIRLFERAKDESDKALNQIPGIFAVIDSSGNILRANYELATLLDTLPENVTESNLFFLFDKHNTEAFRQGLDKSAKSLNRDVVELEVDIQRSGGATSQFVLNIVSWLSERRNDTILFTVTGKDISELKRVSEQKARMQMELESAREIQKFLLPASDASYEKIRLSTRYTPASECGGDLLYYNCIGNTLKVWMGDVTGHGVSSAMLACGARTAIAMIEDDPTMTPGKALTALNNSIYKTANGEGHMTFFVISINIETLACRYSHAGHHGALVFRNDSFKSQKSNSCIRNTDYMAGDASQMLGYRPNIPYPEYKFTLKPGDTIFCCSDGMIEAEGPQGKQFGERPIVKSIGEILRNGGGTKEIIQIVETTFYQFCGDVIQADDVTYWALQVH